MGQMFFWVRELIGWCLVAAAIYLFLICLGFVGDRKVVEAAIVASIGIFVFRGGLSMVKMATAARVLLAEKASADEPRRR